MRISQICPTCTTYINSLCVVYNGTYLSNINASPLDDLDTILSNIDFATGIINSSVAGLNTSVVAINNNIVTLFSNISTINSDIATINANKSTDVTLGGLTPSDVLYPSQKAVSVFVTNQVTTINGSITAGLALKENTANKSNGPLGTSSVLFPTENSVTNALVPKENISDKVTTQATFISNGSSVIKYPAIKAVKDYVDGVTVGLLRDNGNYDPTITGNYPLAADTLSGGPIQVGDLWYISVNGTMNGNAVLVGYSVRALVNGALPTVDADWAIANVGLGFIPEDSANKSTDGTFNSGVPSATLFPTQSAVATWVNNNLDLNQVLTNGNVSTTSLIIGGTLVTPTTSSTIIPGIIELEDLGSNSLIQYQTTGITIDQIIGGDQMQIFYNNNSQTINFPSGSGTLALLSDIPPSSLGWALVGNAGTTPGTNFIGTTDAQDVIFKANGVERLKIDNVFGDVYTTNSFRAYNMSVSTSVQAVGANGYVIIGQDGFYGGGFLAMANNMGSDGVIKCNNLTTSREYQLPDADGTLAINSYKVYSAIVNISGIGAPTVTVLENTLGATITWTKPVTGQVWASASSSVFTSKTFIVQTSVNNGGQPYFVIGERGGFNPLTDIVYNIIRYDGSQTGWPNVTYIPIEIRIYP